MAALEPGDIDAYPLNMVSVDEDLPSGQRSDRADPLVDKNGATLVQGDTANASDTVVTILKHGRGIGYILVGYRDDRDDYLCLATYPVSLITKA